MSFTFTPFIIPLLLTSCLTLGLVAYLWRRRSTPEAVPLTVLLLGITVWSLTYSLELLGSDLPTKIFWARVEYFGILVLPLAWLYFAMRYEGSGRYTLPKWLMAVLYIIPAFILLLVWTPLFEELIWQNPTLRESGPFLILDAEYGWGFWLLILYAYALLLYGSALLMRTALRSAKQHRLQIVVMLVAVLAPWLGNVVYLFDMTPLQGVDFSPFAFTISGVAMTWAMLSHNLTGLIPIARSTMVENMQSGVVVLDKFQQVEYINDPAAATLGLEGKRVEGSGLYELCPSFSRFQDLLEEDAYPPISEVVKCERDGETLWLDLYISALPDRSGALIGHLLMFQDITLRHQEREELRKLRQAVQTSGEAIYMTDPEGVFTYVNPQFTALYGYTPEEVVGESTPRILKSGEHAVEEYERFWDTLLRKEVVPINFINQTKDGQRIHVEGSTNPILDEEGNIQGFLAIQRDVTEEQRAKANLQDRVRELSFLNQLAEASVKTMDEDALIQIATRLMGDIFNPDYFGIMLVDESEQDLYLHSSYQARGGKKDIRVPVGEGITGQVAHTGEQWYVPDVREEPAYISPGLDTRSELCVPLIVAGNVIGVINLESMQVDAFSHADNKLLKTFADQLAVAIERTRLFEKVQTLAITDELTGLHNRRHFFELARTEFERANRYQHPLSVIMVDVDDFKSINDRFGHAVGDQALRKIAQRLRENCRGLDIPGRYGGEEFSIVLPETEMTAALEVAERLRACFSETPLETDAGPLSVTISLGVTSLTEDTPDFNTLLHQADEVLLMAKNSGRNCVRSTAGSKTKTP